MALSKDKAKEKARRLIELAVDDGTPEAERDNAAFRAAKLIHKYDLLSSPLEDMLDRNETVQAAKTVIETVTSPDVLESIRTLGKGIASVRQTVESRRRSRRR